METSLFPYFYLFLFFSYASYLGTLNPWRYFFRMKQEVESGYMGFDSNNKIAWLQERREEQSNPDGLSYPEDEAPGIQGSVDR